MRKFAAALVIVLAACSGGQPTPPVSNDPVSTPGKILERTNDVADQADQRTADLESLLNDG